MATIRIKERASARVGGRSTYYLQIIHCREVKLISTGIRCTGTNCIPQSVEEFARPYRMAVAELDNLGSTYTLQDIILTVSMSRESKELASYIEEKIKELQDRGRTGTANKYKSLTSHLKTFLGEGKWPLAMTDRGKVHSFAQYLQDTGMSRNTLSSYMRPLAALLRCAHHENLLDFDVGWFDGIYRGVDKTAKRAISLEDMRKICALKLDDQPALQLTCCLFIFSFYTMGMSFVDIVRLTKKNIRGNELIYRRSKTGQTIIVPLNQQSLAIIAKYSTASVDYLFPVISSGIKYESALRMHNKRLKKIGELAGCEEPLTSYISRHTWPTVARDSGIEISVISAAMGHTSEKTTRIYLGSIGTSTLRDANDKIAGLVTQGRKKR